MIQNTENGGYAKGYNDALKHIDADVFCLLNNDVEVTKNWLIPIIKTFITEDNTAIIQPKLLDFNKTDYFEYAGAAGGFIDKYGYPYCRGRIFNTIEKDNGQYNDASEIFWASGACLFIRKHVFNELKGLDEAFFAHMEEIDLCWRLKKQNFQFMVVPQSVVYHVGGGTLDYSSPFKTYLNFRNSLFMIIKNHQGWLFPKLFRRMILDGTAGIRFLVRGEMKQLGSILKAHRDVYMKFGKSMKKRKSIQAQSSKFNATGLFKGSILWEKYVLKKDEFHLLPKSKF